MKKYLPILSAALAALLYALSTPFLKMTLVVVEPVFLAGLLYFGAGIGMLIMCMFTKESLPFAKKQYPYVIGMILLDILAPILLLYGLRLSVAENAALLNNFEIVATSVFAFFIFKEKISIRLRYAIIIITIASILLSVENLQSSLSFSFGSVLIILATMVWGLENNFTRNLSDNSPIKITAIKGIFSGLSSILLAYFINQIIFDVTLILLSMLLGFVTYGLSIMFYIFAQRSLGAAKTSSFYALAPFLGAGISILIFNDVPQLNFYAALVLMILGVVLITKDTLEGGQS
ncbi:MAG: DMT family transporter [Erysipelotrichaceae bacterium]|nr:DMT family transporter [Erysipelotrichaceae bacterium]MDP3306058.1 DMT family transporter [Erysipelotrichaceae bacterium]